MIHRALFGAIERFMGVLLEHYAGALPPWLAPGRAPWPGRSWGRACRAGRTAAAGRPEVAQQAGHARAGIAGPGTGLGDVRSSVK